MNNETTVGIKYSIPLLGANAKGKLSL